jgi:hypothetical protein
MPRRPAKITQADIARAIRAAKAEGASEIVVDADGTIHIIILPIIALHNKLNKIDHWTPSEALQRFLKRADSS